MFTVFKTVHSLIIGTIKGITGFSISLLYTFVIAAIDTINNIDTATSKKGGGKSVR